MFELPVQQGWQCPICKCVYSPITPKCWNCGKQDCVSDTEIKPYIYKDDSHTTCTDNNMFKVSEHEPKYTIPRG